MPAASLADLGQLSERLGVDLGAETADGLRGQGTLDDASALIRAEGLAWEDPNNAPDVVISICLAVAMRAYRNPSGATQASVGDVAISYGPNPAGPIYLTKQELSMVRKAAGRSSAGSVQFTSELTVGGDPRWVDVQGGGDPIPLGPWPWEEN